MTKQNSGSERLLFSVLHWIVLRSTENLVQDAGRGLKGFYELISSIVGSTQMES